MTQDLDYFSQKWASRISADKCFRRSNIWPKYTQYVIISRQMIQTDSFTQFSGVGAIFDQNAPNMLLYHGKPLKLCTTSHGSFYFYLEVQGMRTPKEWKTSENVALKCQGC